MEAGTRAARRSDADASHPSSTSSVAQVAAFYKATMAQNGLTIASETRSDGRYALEARSAHRMHQVFLDVLGRSRDTHVSLMDHYTLPRR